MARVLNRDPLPAPGEPVGGVEKSFGEFLSCVMKSRSYRTCELLRTESKGPGIVREEAISRIEKVYYGPHERAYLGSKGMGDVVEKATSLSELSVASGGALVPYEYAYGLMKDVGEDSFFWPRSFVQPMHSRTMLMPLPEPTGSIGTNQVSNLFGGMQLRWALPQGLTETEPAFRNVELVSNELDGYLLASNEMVQDYPGLSAFLWQFITRAVAWFTDQAFLMGLGAGAPQGIVQNPGSVKIARSVGNQVAQQDVSKMWQALLPSSKTRAIWAYSPGAEQFLTNLTGLGGLLYMIPGEDGSQGLLYGRPIYCTEKLPDVGTTGDVCLFDPSLYIVGHHGLFIDYSDQWPTAFLQNQAAFRVVWRGDGLPMLSKQIVLANQATQKVSPFVILANVSGL